MYVFSRPSLFPTTLFQIVFEGRSAGHTHHKFHVDTWPGTWLARHCQVFAGIAVLPTCFYVIDRQAPKPGIGTFVIAQGKIYNAQRRFASGGPAGSSGLIDDWAAPGHVPPR